LRQLRIALPKYPAEYMTFRQLSATHRNIFFRDVSFPLHNSSNFLPLKANEPRLGYFFAMEMAPVTRRRYMPQIVMLTL
jgi:hypothetical protein